jgi:hypothetical protein
VRCLSSGSSSSSGLRKETVRKETVPCNTCKTAVMGETVTPHLVMCSMWARLLLFADPDTAAASIPLLLLQGWF